MLPSAATVGTENWSWSQAVGLLGSAPMQNAAEPEISVGAVQVLPPSCVTTSKIGELMVTPLMPSWKTVQVTMALPLPQAVMYSLSLKVLTLKNEPVPVATRAGVVQGLPPSVEGGTMTSGTVSVGLLPCANRETSRRRYPV